MNQQIKAAVIAAQKHMPEQLSSDALEHQIKIDAYPDLAAFENTEYYDVILIHESFIERFDRQKYEHSSVIVIAKDSARISTVFPRVSSLDVFTVIALPLVSNDTYRYIQDAHRAVLTNKQERSKHMTTGKSIAVTSFANGVGKTVLSYNLACKLTKFFPEESVCLVDMNSPFSNAKSMLNVEERYSWSTLRPILKERELSKAKISNILYETSYGFSLMAGPTEYSENQVLGIEEYRHLVQTMLQQFRSVILDLPTITREEDFDRLSEHDMIVIVVDMSSNAILQTKRGIKEMQMNYPQLLPKLRYVVNKVDAQIGKSVPLVSDRLDIECFGQIDSDPEAINHVIENGKLFDNKEMLLDQQMYDLAESIMRDSY